MPETFTFALLPVESLPVRTKKQQQAAARRTLKKLEHSIAGVYWKITGGHQIVQLQRIVDFCKLEDIEVPLWVKWHLLLHKATQHPEQSSIELDTDLDDLPLFAL